MRVRKSSAYLPVPTHARAASTPSQIEHVNKPISLSAKDLNETILEADKPPQNLIKRAASETPTPKMHHSKRNNYENKNQHHHNHHHHSTKRNVEDNSSSSNKPKVSYAADAPPTAALLAELLKGSSENMLSEQRQKMISVSNVIHVPIVYILLKLGQRKLQRCWDKMY